MARFVLDTNMLLGLTREAAWARSAYDRFNMGAEDVVVFTSIVCKAELLSLAEKRGWGPATRNRMERVLNDFPAVEIKNASTRLLNAYALIDAWSQCKPISDVTLPQKQFSPRNMGKNDIWVADRT